MDHCTFYNHQLVYDQIVRIVERHLPDSKKEFDEVEGFKSIKINQKGGLFSKNKPLIITYRERETPSYHLNQVSCPLEQNLYGMTEFVSSIPAKNQEIQKVFIQKIATINCEYVVSAELGYSKEAKDIINDLCSVGDPFLFVQPSKFFNQSKSQHFLDNHLQLLLDNRGETSLADLVVQIGAEYRDSQITVSESALKRKEHSESILESHGIQINKNLPVIEEEIQLRRKADVLDRIYALVTIAAKGEGVKTEQIGAVMERLQISHFSEQEQDIMSKEELSDQERLNATWRYESLYLLLWSVEKCDTLPYPSVICPVEEIVGAILSKSREEFSNESILRSKEEILDQLDLVYRMNWACVNARIKGEEPSGNLMPGVVFERHYALNWLINYQDQDWDYISTDT